jgi:hypothetical protein
MWNQNQWRTFCYARATKVSDHYHVSAGYPASCLSILFVTVVNPFVVEELYADPQGTKATPVMLLGLPDGKQIPVNYLLEGNGCLQEQMAGGGMSSFTRPLTGQAF